MAAQRANRDQILSQVREITERVCAPEGIEVVDVELKGTGSQRLLRVTIDMPQGVSHQHCEFVSKNAGTILDMEDVIPGGGYRLEVTSPGVERPLRNARDFERFVGHPAKVVLRQPISERRHWEGTLREFSNGEVTLEPASGAPIRFQLGDIERANLVFKW